MTTRARLYGLCCVAATVLLPVLAWAAEREGGHGAAAAGQHGGGAPHVEFWKWSDHAPPIGWMFLDFALFAWILYRYAGPAITSVLANRHDAVKKAMAEAADAKAEALKKAAEFDTRLKALDSEIAALRAEMKQAGESARLRLQESGKRTAERIARDTQATIAAEETRARQVLHEEAARLALELAEKLVAGRLKPDDHKKLRDEFVRELGN